MFPHRNKIDEWYLSTILTTNAMSHHQGGIVLVYKESSYRQVESSVLHGPNVIPAVIVSKNS